MIFYYKETTQCEVVTDFFVKLIDKRFKKEITQKNINCYFMCTMFLVIFNNSVFTKYHLMQHLSNKKIKVSKITLNQ